VAIADPHWLTFTAPPGLADVFVPCADEDEHAAGPPTGRPT
jgi:hypothetical protein